jgi:hypothetical protein
LSLAPPCQLRSLAGQEHGRTIPTNETARAVERCAQGGAWD